MRIAPLLGCLVWIAATPAFAAQPAAHFLGPPRTDAPAGAEVYIVSPQDGATVGEDVTVVFGLKGMGVAPAGVTHAATGHHHLLIDAAGLPPQDLPIPADATHLHFGGGQTQATVHLSPGTHTLQLDLGDAAHMQFVPPIVSKKITVQVKAGAAAASAHD
jgi:hypothetical protein